MQSCRQGGWQWRTTMRKQVNAYKRPSVNLGQALRRPPKTLPLRPLPQVPPDQPDEGEAGGAAAIGGVTSYCPSLEARQRCGTVSLRFLKTGWKQASLHNRHDERRM